jgi:erythromycin esterase-like protein
MKKEGMVNLGQLVREQNPEQDVVLVGFGSYQGTVIAGREWGAPMEIMNVPAARTDSVEAILHQQAARNQLLVFDRNNLKDPFSEVLPHRAIGVVYRPEREKFGNYVPTILNGRYDAFVYLDRTQALFPLHLHPDKPQTPETFPFGE